MNSTLTQKAASNVSKDLLIKALIEKNTINAKNSSNVCAGSTCEGLLNI